jgi:hypothetical protein
LDDLYSRIDISDSFPFHEHRQPPKPVRAFYRLISLIYPGFRQVRDCQKRVPKLRMASLVAKAIEKECDSLLDLIGPEDVSSITDEQEDRAIRAEFSRFARSLYGPSLERPGGKLKRNLLRVIGSSTDECEMTAV